MKKIKVLISPVELEKQRVNAFSDLNVQLKKIMDAHCATPAARRVEKISKSKEWKKYFIPNDDWMNSETNLEEIFNEYEIYNCNTYNEKKMFYSCGLSLKSKARKLFTTDAEWRSHDMENKLNISFAVILHYGGTIRNTPLLEEILHLKKLVSKKDFNTLSWCMFGFTQRYKDFLLRGLNNEIRESKKANSRGGGHSWSKIPAEHKPEIKKEIQASIDKTKTLTKYKTWTWNHKEILGNAMEMIESKYKKIQDGKLVPVKVEFRTMNKEFPKHIFNNI